MMDETRENLERAIATLQAQREIFGDAAADIAINALQRRLLALHPLLNSSAAMPGAGKQLPIDLETLVSDFQNLKEIALQTGETLCHQGTISDGMYFLKQGRLGVYWEQPDQDDYHLSDVLPGMLVGELGAVTQLPRTATLKAEEDSIVIHITTEDFYQLLQQIPPLVAKLVYVMRDRLAEADIARVSLGRSYEQSLDRVQTLRTQKEQLTEVLRLREELSDMVVHDLRNPLGVIITGLDMLEDLEISEADRAHFKNLMLSMNRSTQRMQALVETLLDIARFEQGHIDLQLGPTALQPLLERIFNNEQPLADLQEITLESHAPEDTPLVWADAGVIERVLINLIDNALKFTPANGRVWVEAIPGAESLTVSIVDTGPGIPLQERTRIFEKFTQLPGQPRRRKGVGLGLTFCRLAIEAHGGRIWIEDGPEGIGSRFTFTLPLTPPDGNSID